MRGLKTLLASAALCAGLALAPTANAQISIGIGIQPVCPYGYYDYAPYACSPMGFYGSGYFYNGIFLGMGPWGGWGYSHGWGGHRFGGDGGGNYHGGGGYAANQRFGGGGPTARQGGAYRGNSGGGHAVSNGGGRVASNGGGHPVSNGGARVSNQGGARPSASHSAPAAHACRALAVVPAATSSWLPIKQFHRYQCVGAAGALGAALGAACGSGAEGGCGGGAGMPDFVL